MLLFTVLIGYYIWVTWLLGVVIVPVRLSWFVGLLIDFGGVACLWLR